MLGIEARATILGHLQRGGRPTALDCMHGSVMGALAVEAISKGETNKAVVFREGRHLLVDLEEAINCEPKFVPGMYEMIKTLAI